MKGKEERYYNNMKHQIKRKDLLDTFIDLVYLYGHQIMALNNISINQFFFFNIKKVLTHTTA